MKILFIATLSLYGMSEPVFPDFYNRSLSEVKDNKDWEIIAEARGSLNGDSNEDLAMILESKVPVLEKRCDDCESKNHKVRIFLVLINNGRTLRVVVQNNVFVARADEGGMTTEMKPEISIVNDQLNLSYLMIRGETTYTFESQKDEIVLVKAAKLSASHYIFRSDVVDFKTQTLITESRAGKDEPAQKKTTNLAIDKLTRLADLKMMGSWDVAGVFL